MKGSNASNGVGIEELAQPDVLLVDPVLLAVLLHRPVAALVLVRLVGVHGDGSWNFLTLAATAEVEALLVGLWRGHEVAIRCGPHPGVLVGRLRAAVTPRPVISGPLVGPGGAVTAGPGLTGGNVLGTSRGATSGGAWGAGAERGIPVGV
ncbi:MAG: hypothetical protein U0163_10930 [Gemmatimonadaceae bacterium]